jgi:putative endonuclease
MHERPRKLYWVYIMASRPRGILYVGMTSDRPGRAWQHRERVMEGFTKRYWVGRLVYFEASVAAQRERVIKRWRRDWKIALIEKSNPTWRDLFDEVLAEEGYEG